MRYRYIVWLLLLSALAFLPVGKGYGQTAEDLKLSYRNEIIDTDILVCNDAEPPFRFQLKNETEPGKFDAFKLRLKEGDDVIDMVESGKSKTVEYGEKGRFTLQFIGIKADGREVVKSYSLKIVGKVNARLEKEEESVKCLNSDVKYIVEILSGDTDGTHYFLNYDDKTVPDELNRSKFVNGKGVFVHQYEESYCTMINHDKVFKVSLSYENECYSGELGTVSEYVAIPLQAAYTFDHAGSQVCTYEKLELRNITDIVGGSDCTDADVIAFWDFGNGETSDEWEPYIEYKEAGIKPKIKLVVSNKYACATDSIEIPVDLLDRTKAIIRPDKDKLCVGEELFIENKSTGDNVKYTWSVVSLNGFPSPVYENTIHLRVKFTHWGKYRVTLRVDNPCSYDLTDTVITVIQDPDLLRYDVPDKACLPDVWNMADFVTVMWNGNEEEADWTITRKGGTNNADVEWLEGTNAQSVFPVVRFKQAGVYQVTMRLPDVGCGGTKLTEMKEVTVHDPAIAVKIDTTPLNICEKGTVSFTNTSVGDDLQYEWSVTPQTQVKFIHSTNNLSASPVIEFGRHGDYEVKLHMYNRSNCGEVDTVYRVHVRKNPSIYYFEPPEAVCPGADYLFDFSGSVAYHFYNNPERVTWTIQPTSGWQFVSGDEHTPTPVILFETPGEYSFTVELESAGCPVEDEAVSLLTRKIRVRNSAMTMTAKADNTLVCEGEELMFSMMAETAESDPLTYSWMVSPPDGTTVFKNYGYDKKIAKIQFDQWGDYEVRGAAAGFCGILDSVFKITVQKDPKVGLRQGVKLCQGEYDMSEYVTYQWFNNIPEVKWTVERISGGNKNEGFTIDNALVEYPKLSFQLPGDYRVKVELTSHTLGCEADSLIATSSFHVYDPEIKGTVLIASASEICEGGTVTFMNATNADGGVSWEWRVEGLEDGYVFENGDKVSTKQTPEVTFLKYGDYQVFVKAVASCREKEFPPFPVKVSGVPEVTIADISAVCEPFEFRGKEDNRIVVDPRNDDIDRAQWTITENPASVSAGYEYVRMSDETSLYPDIRFLHGDYILEVKYWNHRCPTPGEKTFNIRVDELVRISSIENDAICSQSPEVRLLTAVPEAGVWSLKNPNIAHASEILYQDGGRYYFNPKFGAYDEQDVTLVYKLYNFSCVDSAEMNMHIWALPYVEAGLPREMCLNHEPQLLVGQDSAAGSAWQANRGHWELNGLELAGHRFRAEEKGDFKLYYYYEDAHHCANVDSTLMTVHVLPDTAFVSQPQYCRGTLADFTVNKGAEEKRYMWEYYAGARLDTVPGNGGYVYEQAGEYGVTLIVESVHGCLDTSSVHRIEVVDDAPQADFSMSSHAECGPEVALRIEVEEANYSDHNLKFEWILGNGTVTEELVPENPQLFYSALEDTVYQVKFRVYNVCNETVKVDSLTVGSLPKVNLLFENGERNCSPLNLKVLNLSTGSHNEYLWYMGDGTEPLKVFEPLDYVYVTDSVRKVFNVSLVAKNQCGRDSLMQPLTVLAQSLRAFFDRPKEEICVGEQICFTNHTRDTARDIRYRYWDFGDEVRDTSWNACHVYRDSGVYKVLLFVDNGCSSDTTSKLLHVIGNPQLKLLVEQEHCDRDTFHFDFTSDQGLRWIEWNLGNDSVVFAPSFTYVYREPGSYPVVLDVIGENRADCRSRAELLLTVHPRPVLQVVPFDTLVCTPYLYVPQVEGEAARMLWDYGDGTLETSAEEHLYVNETDTLQRCTVVLHAFSDKGCPEDYTGYMNIANLPRAEVEKRVTNGRPQKVDLINLSPEGYVDYMWGLPEGKVLHSFEDQHLEFMENGLYEFSLTVENEHGCRDTAVVEHEVMLKGLYFPNTFIPHSLNGQINRFKGIGMGLQRYKLEIFDQYGNKIWETRALEDGKPSEGWDGCNRQGKRMPQGVYIWRAEAIFADDEVWTGGNNSSGVPETTQGTVLLLRE